MLHFWKTPPPSKLESQDEPDRRQNNLISERLNYRRFPEAKVQKCYVLIREPKMTQWLDDQYGVLNFYCQNREMKGGRGCG